MSDAPDQGLTYRQAGVDTVAGQDMVRRIAGAVRSTHDARVLDLPGGFAGLFDASFLKDFDEPVLVSSTDGVGTKLVLASLFDRHDGVGLDLVAMCANDLLVSGARALFFLDYIACGKLNPDKMARIVTSIAAGCRLAGCALVGGETAEHPDTMSPEDYDLGGFVVGAVDRARIIDGRGIQPDDVLIALPSSGVHSNGLSLIRRIFLKNGLHLPDDEADRAFLRDEILKPTVIYEPYLRDLLENQELREHLRGLVHVTGGGFHENLPRVLPDGMGVVIERDRLQVPELFSRIQSRGNVDLDEMFRVFNMGAGMVVVVAAEEARALLSAFQAAFQNPIATGDDTPTPEPIGTPAIIGRVEPLPAGAEERVRFT